MCGLHYCLPVAPIIPSVLTGLSRSIEKIDEGATQEITPTQGRNEVLQYQQKLPRVELNIQYAAGKYIAFVEAYDRLW